MTHYQILGVSKDASQEQIRSAYKNLVKKYHPDLYQGDKSFAEKKTQEINVAYDILSDVNKRAEYDLEITPTTYTTSQNYQYTPPKYSSSYDPYTSYQNKYTYHRYSEYEKKYSVYNEEKQKAQEKANTSNSFFNSKINNISEEFAKKLGTNLLLVLFILVMYIIIFLNTVFKFAGYQKQSELKKTQPHFTENNNSSIDESEDDDASSFDINDYFSDYELRETYYKYYSDKYDSYQEFKEALSEYFYEYLAEYY